MQTTLTSTLRIVLLAAGILSGVHVQGQGSDKTGKEPNSDNTPKSAEQKSLSFTSPEGIWPRSIAVSYTPVSSGYFLFPTFAIADATFASEPGKTSPLFEKDGKIGKLAERLSKTPLRVDLLDLQKDDQWARMIQERIRKEEDKKDLTRFDPRLSREYTASLVLGPHPSRRPTILTSSRFIRTGALSFPVHFQLSAADVELLKGAQSQDIHVEIVGAYRAAFSSPEYKITVQYLARGLKELVSELTGKAEKNRGQFLLSAPGGEIDGKTEGASFMTKSISLGISRYTDSTVDPRMMERAVAMMLDQVRATDKEVREDDKTIVSFLLSNQIMVTAPLGKLKEISESVKTNKEKVYKHLTDEFQKGKTDVQVDANVSVGPFGSFGHGEAHVKSLVENEARRVKLLDQLDKDFEQASKAAKGELSFVTALKVSQLQKFASHTEVEAVVSEQTVRDGDASLTLDLPFAHAHGYRPADFSVELQRLSMDLNSLKKDTETNVKELKQMSEPKFVSGSWDFNHVDPDGTGMVCASGAGSSVPSKWIEFKFPQPFLENPDIHVCVVKNEAKPESSMNIEVLARRDGFTLRAIPFKGVNWTHLGLTWIAVPKNRIVSNDKGKPLPDKK